MLRMFAIQPPTRRGIFRVTSEEEGTKLIERAASLGIPIDPVKEDKVEELLGPFHPRRQFETNGESALPFRRQSGIHPCFWVPDAPFDEAGLMTAIRRAAKHAGAKLVDIDVQSPITLARDRSAENGYFVNVPGDRIEAPVTILCPGAGLPVLLEQLEIPHPLAVYRSALLRDCHMKSLGVPLFVDLETGLSVLQHEKLTSPTMKWTIYGCRIRVRVDPTKIGTEPVTLAEIDGLMDLLPPLSAVNQDANLPVTVCYKTEALSNGVPTVDPWLLPPLAEFPGLYGGVPGKATLALYTAEEILTRAGLSRPVTTAVPSEVPPEKNGNPQCGKPWDNPIRMHWEYDGLDDRRS